MTIRQSFFSKFALAIFGVFILNALASFFFWYQSFTWFDMVMHFFGGVVVTFFLVWFFFKKYRIWREQGTLKTIIFNSFFFIVIAVLWEVMEFSVQHLFDIDGVLATPRDSVSDIFFGLMGSLLAIYYYFMKTRKNERD